MGLPTEGNLGDDFSQRSQGLDSRTTTSTSVFELRHNKKSLFNSERSNYTEKCFFQP